MIKALIFSSDSPMRLDALMRSISINAADVFGTIAVLYRANSESSRKGYEMLKDEFKNVDWVAVSNLKHDVIASMDGSNASAICFLMDCDLFFKDISGKSLEIEAALEDQTVLTFSLRLGENVKKCYLMGIDNRLYGQVAISSNVMKIDWKKHYLDFGNPFCTSGHIYRTQEVLKMIKKITFDSPEEMEDALHIFQEYPKDMMASFNESSLVTIPKTEVMAMVKSRKEKPSHIDEDGLTQSFLTGERIDLDSMGFSNVDSCYLETELKFKKTT